MNDLPALPRDPVVRAMSRKLIDASASQVMRIVATVDGLTKRGIADQLIAPLRQRLRALRPPRPLGFQRLLSLPLNPLIVPATRWRKGHDAIPRTALTPMADHVRRILGAEADAIEAQLAGKNSADIDLVMRLGRSLWPKAARILTEASLPGNWEKSGLQNAVHRPLVAMTAALLDQAVPLDVLCVETADGLLPPRPEAVARMLSKLTAACPGALSMLTELMLVRLPYAAEAIQPKYLGPEAAALRVALDQAGDRLLQQLLAADATEARISVTALADASRAVRGITGLLEQFHVGIVKPERREQMLVVRRRLDAACKARFVTGMQDDFIGPLQRLGNPPDPAAVQALEVSGRHLRALEIEARTVGGASTYDMLLNKAVQAVRADVMRDKLTLIDQVRLVEILAGPDVALAMIE